ncbi:MAG: hypothetical protein Q8L55_15440 [Phycisphaerales bacterium]|nr:hypothetical protein [Phycisphaerales bacterium]
MTAAPLAVPSVAIAPRPPSRAAQRISLTLLLWVLWGAPLGYIAWVGPKMGDVFKEFGVKLSAGDIAVIQVSSLLASPLGLLFLLVALPALALAVAAMILPPRRTSLVPERARWPYVIITVVVSSIFAVAVPVVFSSLMGTTMLSIVEKLQATPPTQGAPAANTPSR